MDFYKFHEKPEQLHGHQEANDIVPDRIHNLVINNKKLTPKQEEAIGKSSEYAFWYAKHIKKPFPPGEDTIAKDDQWSYYYAADIIKKPWPKGEDAISSNHYYSFCYAINVLNRRFPKGEKSIARDRELKRRYEEHFGVKI